MYTGILKLKMWGRMGRRDRIFLECFPSLFSFWFSLYTYTELLSLSNSLLKSKDFYKPNGNHKAKIYNQPTQYNNQQIKTYHYSKWLNIKGTLSKGKINYNKTSKQVME